ncbi:uncharacterized protein LTR77_001095 [Saxophila tyrrhenica]|uniref:Cytochrome P450 n=1 Tax=Saxophila tyrrhenica TaxID=1690608 RepID=A0AAV9PJV5_9PEZI|nr:hypothetical protein LTR77_001095 [Saxophila tyrrhenica]
MATQSMLLDLVAIGILLYGLTLLLQKRKSSIPLPPGPKPLPLVGNIRDLPPSGVREWEHWTKHKDLYEQGPISSISVLGTTIIILNSADAAFEHPFTQLLEKRSHHHSRPRMVFGGEMCGWDHLLVSQTDPNEVRELRKRIHQVIGTRSALGKFEELMEVEVERFLLRTMRRPEEVVGNVKTETGAIILKVAYGYTIEPEKRDPLIDIADRALAQFSAATVPGAWMVDVIPALRYLPDWVPGTAFKQTAREWKATFMDLAERPLSLVKRQMAENSHGGSYVSNLYGKAGDTVTAEEEERIKWSAAALYTGGADTSVSTMSLFFLAMVVNPEVQVKAREEIDRVVGSHKLPTFADRPRLPYIDAVVKECLRWHPIAPMGVPHVTTQDDVYQDYLIPKGGLLIPNIWYGRQFSKLFTHDAQVYEDPMTFNPERFLSSPPPPDPQDFVFGFGRRICPGKLLAETSVWLTVAKSLAVFEISKGVENGVEVEPDIRFTPGIISHPMPFKASIKPRSKQHEDLILKVEAEHPWEESDAEKLQSL